MASNFLMDEPAGPVKTIGSLAVGINALGNISGAVSVDFLRGNVITCTLTGNVTLSFVNIARMAGSPVVFVFTQDATGGRTVSWPATAKFETATAPVVKAGAGATDTFTFWGDGTNIYLDPPANPNFNSMVATAFSTVVNAITYGASMTPDLSKGGVQTITVTNNSAFTVNNPANVAVGMEWTLNILNSSGGSMGTVSFGGAFRLGTFTAPANNKARVGTFYYDGTNHWLVGGFGADI